MKFKDIVEKMKAYDPTGIINAFIHVGDNGDLYDYQRRINVNANYIDVYMYPIRFGFKYSNHISLMNQVFTSLVFEEETICLYISFTPNHYDEFISNIEAHIEAKIDNIKKYPSNEADEELISILKEKRFIAKEMRNCFHNNSLYFEFNRQLILS